MKAKHVSMIGKILSVLFLCGAYLTTAYLSKRPPSGDEVLGMLQVALFIGGAFLPVDISLIVQNIKGMKDAVKP